MDLPNSPPASGIPGFIVNGWSLWHHAFIGSVRRSIWLGSGKNGITARPPVMATSPPRASSVRQETRDCFRGMTLWFGSHPLHFGSRALRNCDLVWVITRSERIRPAVSRRKNLPQNSARTGEPCAHGKLSVGLSAFQCISWRSPSDRKSSRRSAKHWN
jgi:hypothetical protein